MRGRLSAAQPLPFPAAARHLPRPASRRAETCQQGKPALLAANPLPISSPAAGPCYTPGP